MIIFIQNKMIQSHRRRSHKSQHNNNEQQPYQWRPIEMPTNIKYEWDLSSIKIEPNRECNSNRSK
jgi:hypothetical protein